MDDYALVLNAGSSSLKFCVYERPEKQDWRLESRGQIEGIGAAPRISARDAAGRVLIDKNLDGDVRDGIKALEILAMWLRSTYGNAHVVGVGHRVVHGGSKYAGPMIVTPQVLAELHRLVPLAPLHQPHNLAAIEAVSRHLPGVPQVACFDTSFHRSLPPVAKLVPLPGEIRGSELQRYGFHGLSYEYIASVLPQVAPGIARNNVIVAHLGNGASVCALKDGKSVDHSFGFTALDGLCMGTRPGAVDPGVILYLVQNLSLSPGSGDHPLPKVWTAGHFRHQQRHARPARQQRTGGTSRGGLFCLPRGEGDRRDVRCIERDRRTCLHRRYRRKFGGDPPADLQILCMARH